MGLVHDLLSDDHRRLEALLARVARGDGSFDLDAYLAFRAGLARHIGIEEKLLFPAARRGGVAGMEQDFAALRADHARLGWLIVWMPSHGIVDEIRARLTAHDRVEERSVYSACEGVLDDADALADAIRRAPAVPMRAPQEPRT